jgi:tetratricopeptide (TPR) repeat protein
MLSPAHQRHAAALQEAEQALVRGDFAACAEAANGVIAQDAVNVPAHLFRGVASNQLGDLERAVQDLMFVVERQPNNLRARFYLGQALRRSGQFDPALPHLQAALDDPGLRPHAQFELARSYRGLGRFNTSIEHYQALLRETPNHADAAANLAMLLEKTSQLDDALAWAERATVLAPANTAALLTRARVTRRLGRFEEAAHQLESLLGRELPFRSRVIAANQLGHCLDRLERYDEAFDRFREANELQKANDPEALVDHHGCYGIDLARFFPGWLDEHPVEDWSPAPADDRAPPVFLVGFPRSGTTLLDQVLSAHPRIEVIEEQELLLEVRRQWISRENFPRLTAMNDEEIREARRLYRQARAAAQTDPSATVIVDKLPLNTMYLPLIHRLFPDARILFSLRDPRDVCLSCYFQSFSLVGAMPYFLDLQQTAEYYDAVMALGEATRKRLPLREATVRYEALVTDLEGTMRPVLDHLGVPWHDAVLDYRTFAGGRDINTPSYQQVSEPLYQRSVGRWKHYRRQMAAVEPLLEPWVEHFGFEPR